MRIIIPPAPSACTDPLDWHSGYYDFLAGGRDPRQGGPRPAWRAGWLSAFYDTVAALNTQATSHDEFIRAFDMLDEYKSTVIGAAWS